MEIENKLNSSASFSNDQEGAWGQLKALIHSPLELQAVLWIVGVSALSIDQLTKWWIEANLESYNREDIIFPFPNYPQLFNIFHVENRGAAFGTLQGYGFVFTTIAFIVAGFILFYNATLLSRSIPFRVALGLVWGGALGNAIDRLRIGHVTDFLNVNVKPLFVNYPWIQENVPYLDFPIFNMADVFIVSGVCTLVVLMWRDDLPIDPWSEIEDFDDDENIELAETMTSEALPATPIRDSSSVSSSLARRTAASAPLNIRDAQDDYEAEPITPSPNAFFGMRALLAIVFLIILLIVGLRILGRRRRR
ncbi:MAG: signal peptidase II [Chloroflexota bacterium]